MVQLSVLKMAPFLGPRPQSMACTGQCRLLTMPAWYQVSAGCICCTEDIVGWMWTAAGLLFVWDATLCMHAIKAKVGL